MTERAEVEDVQYTPKEVMALLGIKRTKMYQLIREGLLETVRIPGPGGVTTRVGARGAPIRITASEIARFRKTYKIPPRSTK